VYNNNGHVDAWIVGMARASGGKVAIVTNDTLLVKRLHSFQGLRISKLSKDGRLRY
jgi:rRNA-processing protein FCF1